MISNDDVRYLEQQLETLKLKTNLTALPTAIYARKSKEDVKQSSISSQIANCKETIANYSFLQLIAYKNGAFSDDGESGMFTDTRKDYLELRRLVKDDLVKVVVVYSYDRLSRAISDFATFEHEIESRGRSDCQYHRGLYQKR